MSFSQKLESTDLNSTNLSLEIDHSTRSTAVVRTKILHAYVFDPIHKVRIWKFEGSTQAGLYLLKAKFPRTKRSPRISRPGDSFYGGFSYKSSHACYTATLPHSLTSLALKSALAGYTMHTKVVMQKTRATVARYGLCAFMGSRRFVRVHARACWLSHSKMVSIIPRGVSRETSSCCAACLIITILEFHTTRARGRPNPVENYECYD